MAISFFKTLDYVLSQNISEIRRFHRISEDDAIHRAKQFLVENSAAYYSENPSLHYNDPLCRFAYLYTYVGAHANLVDNAFYRFNSLGDFVENKLQGGQTLHICSLGGGPGSELLGFVKFIERVGHPKSRVDLSFTLIDTIPEWDETWHALVQGMEETFKTKYGASRRDWPIVVHRSFLPLNLTRLDDFKHFAARFKEIEIFILNHTVSELLAYKDDLRKVFNNLVERAPDGTYFLFIDRNQQPVLDLVNSLLNNSELVSFETKIENKNMDGDEQKSDLGRWYSSMGRDPKLTWKAFYSLAQKKAFPF